MDITRRLSFLVFVLCLLISLKNQGAEINRKAYGVLKSDQSAPPDSTSFLRVSEDEGRNFQENLSGFDEEWLRYDYYNESCPSAEQIIRSTVRELYSSRPEVAAELLRLVFHDCFVEGCDASILLDSTNTFESEKDVIPNQSLKGFDTIDIIKSEVEEACPGIVSCTDIIVLAAREGVLLGGGPFYPLYTGRRDSTEAFAEVATYELPSPQDDLLKAIESFASRGFDERETVTLLGAHSIGNIHCKFFYNRLYNFSGTDEPDPSIDSQFLELLRSKCNGSDSTQSPSASPSSPRSSPSPSSSSSPINSLSEALFRNTAIKMDYEGPRTGFGTLYYRSLLQGKGLLFVDQQLTAGEETETWVRAYASDLSLFKRDFGSTMIKLSNLQVLTAPWGEIRLDCRSVN